MVEFLKKLGLLFVIIVAGYYMYLNIPKLYARLRPCSSPITYTIGTFDDSFGISRSDFLDALNKAAEIWEKPIGRKLFAYDPHGSVPVNLIYDNRQQTTTRDMALSHSIAQNKEVADSVKQEYQSLESQYDQMKGAYDAELSSYNQKLEHYNSEVDYWNSRGGATRSEYTTLATEKDSLVSLRNSMSQMQASLNNLAAQINALIQKYNLVAEQINSNVATVNSTAGQEFSEGEYIQDATGARINIYEFTDKAKLVRVLAHELGHALGLEHNSNPDSIMYALNQSTNEKPTTDDLQELKAVCGVK